MYSASSISNGSRKRKITLLIIFAVVFVLFALLSKKIDFHDVAEYITVAKYFAGIDNLNLFLGHSIVYSFIISPIIKLFPSLLTFKLSNLIWLASIGAIFLFWLKKEKAFIIYAFAPLVWFIGLQTTPILPATLFFFISFIFLTKTNHRHKLFLSGLFAGLSLAVYDPMFLVLGILILVFFWRRRVSELLAYLIAIAIGFSPRFLIDYLVFGNPAYSLIKFFGTNVIMALGIHPQGSTYTIVKQLTERGILGVEGLLIILVVSPLLFKLYKVNPREIKKELIFLVITGLVLFVRMSAVRYFFIIAPILILMLSEVLSKKDIKIHAAISIIIIVLMTNSFFLDNHQVRIQEDIKNFVDEFGDYQYAVVYPANYANRLAFYSMESTPRFVWFGDYSASLKDETFIRGYEFEIGGGQSPQLKDTLKVSAQFHRPEQKSYENYVIIAEKRHTLNEFEKIKCYQEVCVYKNKENQQI